MLCDCVIGVTFCKQLPITNKQLHLQIQQLYFCLGIHKELARSVKSQSAGYKIFNKILTIKVAKMIVLLLYLRSNLLKWKSCYQI